jgi:hypothetical protein
MGRVMWHRAVRESSCRESSAEDGQWRGRSEDHRAGRAKGVWGRRAEDNNERQRQRQEEGNRTEAIWKSGGGRQRVAEQWQEGSRTDSTCERDTGRCRKARRGPQQSTHQFMNTQARAGHVKACTMPFRLQHAAANVTRLLSSAT